VTVLSASTLNSFGQKHWKAMGITQVSHSAAVCSCSRGE